MTTTTSNKTTTIEKENKTTKNKRIQVTKPFEMMMNALALSRDLWIRKKSPEKKQMHPKSMDIMKSLSDEDVKFLS